MKPTAGASTFLVAGLVVARLLDAPEAVVLPLFMAVVATIAILLWRGLVLTRKIAGGEEGLNRYVGLAHILAHAVPLSYIIATDAVEPTQSLNLAYLAPFLFFYYSGRRLWKMLALRFGTGLYRSFVLGNTGMLSGLAVLTVLGHFWPDRFGPASFRAVVLGYFAIHFLLTGMTMLRIEADLKRETDAGRTPP